MMRVVPTNQIWLQVAASLSLAVLAMACGSDAQDDPDATPEQENLETTAIIGAAGGVIEVTHTESSLFGLRLDIPAGAFFADTEVTVSPRDSSDSSPALAPGLAALGLGFDILTDTPFAEDIQIAFPIRAAVEQEGQLLSAFYYDESTLDWTVEFPGAVDAEAFSILTRRTGAWRWGLTLLRDVEDESLLPALVSTYGEETIALIEQGIQDFIDEQLGELQSVLSWNSCDVLNGILDAVIVKRNEAKALAEANLNGSCGPCELGVDVLIGDLKNIIKAKFIKIFGEQLIDNIDFGGSGIGGFIAGIALEALAKSVVDAASMPELSCDYGCYYDENPDLYWQTLGAYYAAEATIPAILIGAVVADCVLD